MSGVNYKEVVSEPPMAIGSNKAVLRGKQPSNSGQHDIKEIETNPLKVELHVIHEMQPISTGTYVTFHSSPEIVSRSHRVQD